MSRGFFTFFFVCGRCAGVESSVRSSFSLKTEDQTEDESGIMAGMSAVPEKSEYQAKISTTDTSGIAPNLRGSLLHPTPRVMNREVPLCSKTPSMTLD